MRRLDTSHCRYMRGPYGTSARLASSTGSARAVMGVPDHPARTTPARSADTTTSRGASGRSADDARLEAVRPDVCHTGVHGHGLATRCDHRVSCRLHLRADTDQAPAAIARAVITACTTGVRSNIMDVQDRLGAERPSAPGWRARERQAPREAPQLGERAQRLKEWSEQALDALLASLRTDLEGL